MKAIKYRNGIEEDRGEYPRMDMEPVKGLESGLEWKLIVEDTRPLFKIDLEKLERVETDNDNSHDVYTHLKVIDVTWNVVRKSDAEITKMIKDAENMANESLVKYTDRLKFMFLYMGIVNRKVDGDNINSKMQTLLDNLDAKLVKLWQNDTELQAKLQQLSDGQDPDIYNNWTDE